MNVKLKKINILDADKIARWKSDPILAEEIMSSFKDTNIEIAENWIRENTEDEFQRLKGIYLKKDNSIELLGITRLMYIDFYSLNAEMGIYIGETKYQNIGIGKKALNLTLELGFNELLLTKIYLKVLANNFRAINLYEKMKFRIEGRLKEHYIKNEEFEDVVCMALFKEDFI